MYAVFAKFSAYGDTVFYLRDNITSDATVLMDIKKADWEGKTYPWDLLDAGMMDEYLPVYKHTFKPNGDGTYYWAKTELETAGKEIPPSVLSASSVPEETPGNPATDNGETTAPATDTPARTDTSAPTDGAAEEASFPWVWVCIGGAVVIVALGAVLLMKKKNQKQFCKSKLMLNQTKLKKFLNPITLMNQKKFRKNRLVLLKVRRQKKRTKLSEIRN